MSDTFRCDLRLVLEAMDYAYFEGTNGTVMDKHVTLAGAVLYRIKATTHNGNLMLGAEIRLGDGSSLWLTRLVGWREGADPDELQAAIRKAEQIFRQAWTRLGCRPMMGTVGPLTRIQDAADHS